MLSLATSTLSSPFLCNKRTLVACVLVHFGVGISLFSLPGYFFSSLLISLVPQITLKASRLKTCFHNQVSKERTHSERKKLWPRDINPTPIIASHIPFAFGLVLYLFFLPSSSLWGFTLGSLIVLWVSVFEVLLQTTFLAEFSSLSHNIKVFEVLSSKFGFKGLNFGT